MAHERFPTNRDRRSFLIGAAAGAASLVATRVSLAQSPPWAPTRPVRIIVAFPPGGLTDTSARLLAPRFSEWLGQPVIVDNRPGAGGNIGTEAVVRSPADGLTIMMAQAGQITVNPHTFPGLSFDTLRDLAPIGMVRTGEFVLVVHPSLGVNSVQELVALLKKNPGKYDYGTTSPGGQVHVITEIFKARTGVAIEAVHYKGAGQSTPEVLAGRVPMIFDAVPALHQHIQKGSLKPLMVAADRRSSLLPDVPTAKEAGIADFNFLNWFALFAPRGTPQPIIDRYAALTRQALALPAVVESIRGTGDQPGDAQPDTLAAVIAREHRVIGEIVRAHNIRAS